MASLNEWNKKRKKRNNSFYVLTRGKELFVTKFRFLEEKIRKSTVQLTETTKRALEKEQFLKDSKLFKTELEHNTPVKELVEETESHLKQIKENYAMNYQVSLNT